MLQLVICSTLQCCCYCFLISLFLFFVTIFIVNTVQQKLMKNYFCSKATNVEQKIKCTLIEALCLQLFFIIQLTRLFFFLAELNNSFSQSLFKEDDLKKIERLEKFIKVKNIGWLGSREIFSVGCGAKIIGTTPKSCRQVTQKLKQNTNLNCSFL